MEKLAGFRDFYPADCARRNYIIETWRSVARRYGFVEFDGPVVESMELYEKKSGGELVGQIFTVGASAEPGSVKGALRPEMTPTLARMVAARERDFKKPMKWFCVPNFFRHERQQRGRLREFLQLNCDIIGEASPSADAELIAVLIDTLRAFGLTEKDFFVRLSSRQAWADFAANRGLPPDQLPEFLEIIDKLERTKPEETDMKLRAFGLSSVSHSSVEHFARYPDEDRDLMALFNNLNARGLGKYVDINLTIVRGLAYYTGIVFEVFDRAKDERALAGGGRYDRLLALMSDGKVDLPALGFGMGDVVLANLIEETPAAKAKMDAWCAAQHACDIYVVIAKEELRPKALALVQELRDAGRRVDFPLVPAKVGKQFQTAEHLGARLAAVVGDEWTQLKVKTLATREERTVSKAELLAMC